MRCSHGGVAVMAMATLLVAPLARAWGQGEFPEPTEEQEKGAPLTDIVRRVPYDPAGNGPIFAVALPTDRTRKEIRSLRGVAEAFGRKFVNVGRITVLAPREMTLIAVPSGNPDARRDFSPSQAFTLILESLTDAQLALLSGGGLTRADLPEAQRSLFDALFPKPVIVYPGRIFREDGTNTIESHETEADAKTFTTAELRLRLVRQAEVSLKQIGGEETYGVTGDNRRDDEAVWTKKFDSFDKDEKPPDTAYGRAVFPKVPSRLKPSELDYAASALNVSVSLSEKDKTLGETIERVAAATRLELYADRRIAGLPAVWRVGPGETARAGDVLEALAWSVTGAFRRLGSPPFLRPDERFERGAAGFLDGFDVCFPGRPQPHRKTGRNP